MKHLTILLGIALYCQPATAQVKQPTTDKPPEMKVVTQVQTTIGTIALTGFNFELGKQSLAEWTKEGTAFNNQPTYGHNVVIRREMDNPQNPFRVKIPLGGDYWKDLSLPVGHKGKFWIGTYENRGDSSQPFARIQGSAPVGTLLSPEFTITKDFICFLVGGSNDNTNEIIELIYDGQSAPQNTDDKKITGNQPRVINVATQNNLPLLKGFVATGRGSSVMRRVWWDVKALKGKKARIKITDNSTTGYINVDDIRFQDQSPDQTDIKIGASLTVKQVFQKDGNYYDWDFPLWGAIDTHTHPAAHIGFGNRLFHGEPVGTISKALTDCEIDHGADIFRTLTSSSGERISGNIIRNAVAGAFDPGHRLGVMDPGNTWGSNEL
jgi:hypothetical protein